MISRGGYLALRAMAALPRGGGEAGGFSTRWGACRLRGDELWGRGGAGAGQWATVPSPPPALFSKGISKGMGREAHLHSSTSSSSPSLPQWRWRRSHTSDPSSSCLSSSRFFSDAATAAPVRATDEAPPSLSSPSLLSPSGRSLPTSRPTESPSRTEPVSYMLEDEVLDGTSEYEVLVRAYYVGKAIKLTNFAAQVPDYPSKKFKNFTVFGRAAGEGGGGGGGGGGESGGGDDDAGSGGTGSIKPGDETHFVVFDYGSVVFFNMALEEREGVLKLATLHSEVGYTPPALSRFAPGT